MPSDYTIDASQRIVWTVSEGQVTDVDLLGMYQRMRTDAGFNASFNELCDFTSAGNVQVTTRALRRLALESPFDEETRHAIVAPQAVVYGLARMYQAYTESAGADRVRVFNDLEPACRWLGIRSVQHDR